MRSFITMITLACFAAPVCAAPGTEGEGKAPLTYELYSWQSKRTNWNFCLLYTTNRQKTVKEILNDKSVLYGVETLKKKLSTLPVNTTVVWFDRLTLGGVRIKGSESLKYPTDQIIDEIRHYGSARGIEISVAGGTALRLVQAVIAAEKWTTPVPSLFWSFHQIPSRPCQAPNHSNPSITQSTPNQCLYTSPHPGCATSRAFREVASQPPGPEGPPADLRCRACMNPL